MRLASVTGYNEMQSAARKVLVRNGTVKTGIDVLEATHFAALHPTKGGGPRSIGLLTNQTGMDCRGAPDDRCAGEACREFLSTRSSAPNMA